MISPSRELITPEEAAKRLGITAAAVRHHLRNGQVPGVKLGRAWRVDWEALTRRKERG